jgi:glycerophosphoryl diester phosphodiesterase
MTSSHPYVAGDSRPPLIIAHRGGSGLWPENTLFAFHRAADLGGDMLETDLHATADGSFVLIHDDTVDRTTNGTGRVNRMTLAELRSLDAGYRWTGDGGATFPFREKGLTIPTIGELLREIPHIRVNIDIKERELPVAPELCRVIRHSMSQRRVMVASFDSGTIEVFRSVCPEVATSASEGEVKEFFSLSRVPHIVTRSYPFHALQVPQYANGTIVVTERFVTTAHRCGLQVHVWPNNEVDGLPGLMQMGLDGIITDFPDRALYLRNGTDQHSQSRRQA